VRVRALLLAVLLAVCGCEKNARNMYEQARYQPLQPSPLFADGSSSREAVAGTVAHSRGTLPGTSSGRIGWEAEIRRAETDRAESIPVPVTRQFVQRGRERFDIYCAPCHSPVGDGDGMIVRRGFPQPPSYHIDRLRQAPDRHFYDVITNGYGIMYSYAGRLDPADRWAIVAYIRALQLSQSASIADLPAAVAARLKEERR
jgi:mono/diheme cytochrome c family protein